MSELFEPLENAIRDQLIPTLVEQEVSDAKNKHYLILSGMVG